MSLVTIPALSTIVDRQFKEDRTLCPVRALKYYLDRTKDLRGPRSLFSSPLRKDIRPATLSSWLNQLSYFAINNQINKPRTWSKSKRMTLGPSRPLSLLQWGIGGPNHASVSLESSQHIYKVLPKRPYLVRQLQQYVSGISSSGTTSPRPSPQHTHLREEKKSGGTHPLQPSLQESIPGSRYWLPLQMFTVRSLIFLTV